MKGRSDTEERVFGLYLQHPLSLNKQDIYVLKKLVEGYGPTAFRQMGCGLEEAGEKAKLLYRKLNYFGRRML